MNFLKRFRSSRNGEPRAVRMTWAKSSAGRAISRTGLFFKRQLWVWPILAVVLLSLLGLVVRWEIESTMRQSLAAQLSTLADVETAMLETWVEVQRSNAESAANNREIRQLVYPLLEDAGTEKRAEGGGDLAAATAKLAKALGPMMAAHDYVGFFVVDRNKRIVAATHAEVVGQNNRSEYDAFLTKALNGAPNVSAPFRSRLLLKDDSGELRTGLPTMFVSAPIRDESFQVVGALALRMQPEEEFSRILSLGRFGNTGETYAFDKDGLLVSKSRFDDELVLLGLLPDDERTSSILTLQARDPGGDITRGFRPSERRRDLPLTHMAAEAVAGRPGVDVAGYRDYRGVPVVGAWRWLPDADIGLATEIDYDEAFRPLMILRRTFWGLFALLVASAGAIFVFTIVVARLHRRAQKAEIAAEQIGQYKLEQKLGSGGMGVVYKGQHAMLRRPTAIKMLEPDKLTPASIERFEREVQVTSQLCHPNTVAIYDYGRTPQGVFYYAMEYLDGIDLQSLVERFGPLPAPRAIHILLQICGSLYEAHSLGLVHRDIKPANIMLNRRGGEPDVVKVLDFGLVKALDDKLQAGMTQQASLTGTPLYMSPEAIQLPSTVDARSDLYAVGAVGYFLLTGQAVFDADSVVDLCQKHVSAAPTPPSQRGGVAIPAALESAILACLEKSRAKRPQTARELALLIGRCAEATQWSVEEADAWWGSFERGQVNATTVALDVGRRPASAYAATVDRS
jgi:hypothetical protein